jgi:hypothetical protein
MLDWNGDGEWYSFMKTIDFKSFLIGLLFATTVLLGLGATRGTQDVRIIGIDKKFGDWDAILVETK